jgi:nucleoside phosphorylase
MRPALVITALMCEATPLIEAWGLRPLRGSEVEERFQLFYGDGVYLGVSGIGKLRAAVATSALLTHLLSQNLAPIAVNIGIAGSPPGLAQLGDLVLVHKVRDVATNSRLYPDILLKHSLKELPLDTYDHPVTTPPSEEALVDMECAGFMQAATTLVAPSETAVLKVISDTCDGTRVSPQQVSQLVRAVSDSITATITSLRREVPAPHRLNDQDLQVLELAVSHARLSVTQRIELERAILATRARGDELSSSFHSILTQPIKSKDQRRIAFAALLETLRGGELP